MTFPANHALDCMKPGSIPEVHGEKALIVPLIPALRAFARTLCRDPDGADDLVQETLTKAIANIDTFTPGTRMKSWLFTIMRNTFYTQLRIRRRESPGLADDAASRPTTDASQEWTSQLRDVQQAIERLPPHQREVLILVSVIGVSYEETAAICKCVVGTVKSRLNRARANLLNDLGEKSARSAVEHRRLVATEYFACKEQGY